MPPGFCANAASAPDTASSAPAATSARRFGPICRYLLMFTSALRAPRKRLLVEPDVFHPVAVVDAVDHGRQPLDIGLRAGPAARIKDDRPGALLGQPPFDLPHQLLALCPVGLGGLLVDQVVDLRIAVAGIVPYRPAHVARVEGRSG